MKKKAPVYSIGLGYRAWRSIMRSWWVFVCIGMVYICYERAIGKKEELGSRLQRDLQALSLHKEQVLEERQDLLAQIQSQSDPEWIILMLMKQLGVVPEGQIKVYFQKVR